LSHGRSKRAVIQDQSVLSRHAHQRPQSGGKDSTLIVRDLAGEPPQHIDDSFAIARNTPPEQLSPSQRAVLELSDALVSELKAADIIIVAAGMINFGIPSTLKSYIDYILRPRHL
jgi:FMN-dependent NADH-azoreductase